MTDLRNGGQIRGLVLLGLLAPLMAHADVTGAVNAVRSQGCAQRREAVPPLQASARLDAVAHHLAEGRALREAQQLSGYHAVSSFSVTISEVPPSGDVSRIIATQFCPQATDPAFREIGVWRQGAQVWIALAEPFAPPQAAKRASINGRVLELVNAARLRERRCGTRSFPAVAPLSRSALLENSALAYAQDMAEHGYMDHTGRDGSSPQQRITRAGYAWVEAGENLASGVMNSEAVVDGWLHSPGHCANLMQAAYTQMGVGFAVNARNDAGVYWALEFGRPASR